MEPENKRTIFHVAPDDAQGLFPTTIWRVICRQLGNRELSRVGTCSEALWKITTPLLYTALRFHIHTTGPDKSSVGMITSLLTGRECLLWHLKHIEVKSQISGTEKWLQLVQLMLCRILLKMPKKQLTSFHWRLPGTSFSGIVKLVEESVRHLSLDGPMIVPEAHFPHLRTLRCLTVNEAEQTAWVGRQMVMAPLRVLELGSQRQCRGRYYNDPPGATPLPQFRSMDLPVCTELERLDLAEVNLLHWPFTHMPRLTSLSLRSCRSTHTALSTFRLHNGSYCQLKRLKIVASERSLEAAEFLTWLRAHSILQELHLELYDSEGAFPLDSVRLHCRALVRLVIESRRTRDDYGSPFGYEICDLEQLMDVADLSIALNLAKYRWRRALRQISYKSHSRMKRMRLLNPPCARQVRSTELVRALAAASLTTDDQMHIVLGRDEIQHFRVVKKGAELTVRYGPHLVPPRHLFDWS